MTIDILEDRELLVERIIIVLLEVCCEDTASFFNKKFSFFTIDELSDIFTGFGRLNKRKPDRFWFFVDVSDNMDTLSTVELVV
ncbi:MAG: hypothetical protein WAW59_07260 [Patescibacteria group bacterium]